MRRYRRAAAEICTLVRTGAGLIRGIQFQAPPSAITIVPIARVSDLSSYSQDFSAGRFAQVITEESDVHSFAACSR